MTRSSRPIGSGNEKRPATNHLCGSADHHVASEPKTRVSLGVEADGDGFSVSKCVPKKSGETGILFAVSYSEGSTPFGLVNENV